MWCDGCDRVPGCRPYCYILAAVLHTDVGCTPEQQGHSPSILEGSPRRRPCLTQRDGQGVCCLHLNLSAVL